LPHCVIRNREDENLFTVKAKIACLEEVDLACD